MSHEADQNIHHTSPQLRWPGGRTHALTSSWDDGNVFDRRLIAIFDRHGLKATFCINSGWCADAVKHRQGGHVTPEELATTYARHELAVHGPNHAAATRIPQSAWLVDVMTDRRRLEAWTGRIIRGASWPFGSFGAIAMQAMAPAGIAYCRGLELHLEGKTEFWLLPERDQWYNWRPSCFYREVLEKPTWYEEFRRRDTVANVFFLWGHSHDIERDGTWDAFEAWCARVGPDAGVWHATNIEIHDYLEAWRALHWSTDHLRVHNPTATAIWAYAEATDVEILPGATVELQPRAAKGA